jgi:hypothetical protein
MAGAVEMTKMVPISTSTVAVKKNLAVGRMAKNWKGVEGQVSN